MMIGQSSSPIVPRKASVNTMGPVRVSAALVGQCRTERAQAYRHAHQRYGLDRRQYFWRTSGSAIAYLSSAYLSSKAAVNIVMRSLAIDLAPRGITSVVVNPGWVRTDMGGPNATSSPAESVSRLRRLIETLGPSQSGKF